MPKWIVVETGNWYSEYKCPSCDKHITIQPDADPPGNYIGYYKECPKCNCELGTD